MAGTLERLCPKIMDPFILIFLSTLEIIWAQDSTRISRSLDTKPSILQSEIKEYIDNLFKRALHKIETDFNGGDVSKSSAFGGKSSTKKEPIYLEPKIKQELLGLFSRSECESVPESPVDVSLDLIEGELRAGSVLLGAANTCEDMYPSCLTYKEMCNDERVSEMLKKECPQTCGKCNTDCKPSKCQYKDELGFTKKGICSHTSQPAYYEVGESGCKGGCKCHIPIGQKGYKLPSECERIKINGEFSLFKEDHKEVLMSLIRHFESFGVAQPEKLPQYIKDMQPYINVRLFVAAYSNFLLNLGIKSLPPMCEMIPEDYVPCGFVDNLEKESKNTNVGKKKRQVEQQDTVTVTRLENGDYSVIQKLDLSGNSPILEHRLAYFREDHGMNSHHFNWHNQIANVSAVARGGELFIHMHREMLKRYNVERFAVGLPPVVQYSDFYTPIEVGHRSNLGYSARIIGVREDNRIPWDFATRDVIADLNDFKERLDNQIRLQIHNDSRFLFNLEQYHNRGHRSIADAVDNIEGERYPNVMSFSETAARDNVFYRWHQHIDDFYEEYAEMKRQGSSVTLREMAFSDIELESVRMYGTRTDNLNQLMTGCGYHQMDITDGLALFNSNINVMINMIHLDHEPFYYVIRYTNQAPFIRSGVVRIFLAPINDNTGNAMHVEEQRKYWIEMDKFKYDFVPGINSFRRRSSDSSVSVDCRSRVPVMTNCEEEWWCRMSRQQCQFSGVMRACPNTCGLCNSDRQCGCGWPQHLLLPRGTPDGMNFNLFVIVTDEDNIEDWEYSESTYCGSEDTVIHDTREMGFPFHAPAPEEIGHILHFPGILTNSAVTPITIYFSGDQTNTEEDPVDGCGRG